MEALLETIDNLLNIHAPYKKLSKQDIKFKNKPWISGGLKNSIKQKNKLFKLYINSKNPEAKILHHINFKKHRNMLETLMKESKRQYFINYFNKNSDNLKATWKGIRNIINLKSKSESSPKSITHNNVTMTDPVDISNAFNDYFTSIGKSVQSNIPSSIKHFSNYLNDPNPNSLFIKPTDSTEILTIINSLDLTKSSGPNSIPVRIMKLLNTELSEHFSNIFNLSFTNGIFPDILKIAKVVPIHKKESKILVSNYRPISLLSNIEKILEKLMHCRLYDFLDKSRLIYELQFGFRQKYSTSYALLNLTENIRQALDDRKFACGIFVDLQKAFDTVDTNILLTKLQYYGIRGIALQWFKSYLTNRKQFVCINGNNSNHSGIEIGVPQGSVLGPLLFLIYINDLNKAIKFCKVHHFADDTNLLHVNRSIKSLNKYVNYDLKNLTTWLNANKISLNVSKTELIIFKPKNNHLTLN